MNLQGIQQNLAIAGQYLQNVGEKLVSKLKDLVVSAGEALKQIGNAIKPEFTSLMKSLPSRNVEKMENPTPRGVGGPTSGPLSETDLDKLLEDMPVIEVNINDDEDMGIPPPPKDHLDDEWSDVSEHSWMNRTGEKDLRSMDEVTLEDISQTPQNGVLSFGIEDISQTPQHGVLSFGIEDISQTSQNGVLSFGIEDISQTPQRGVLLDDISRPSQHGILESKMPEPQRAKLSTFENRLNKLNMLSGDKAVESSGLVKSHVEEFKKVASETNTILMFRPVNLMSTGLLAEGTAAKGLNVHGKSSDWGPMAGFIAVDQNLSKKHDDKKAIEKGIAENQHSLNHEGDRVGFSQLTLTNSRLSYLLENKLMSPCDENGKPIDKSPQEGPQFFRSGGNKNENYLFKLDSYSEGGFSVSYKSMNGKKPVVGEAIQDWAPLNVMGGKLGKESTPIPLTADYDVFAMLPKIGDGQLAGKKVESKAMQKLTQSLVEAKKQLNEARSSGAKETIQTARREVVKLGIQIAVQQRKEAKEGQSLAGVVNQARSQLLGQDDRRELDPELGRLTGWQRGLRDQLNEAGIRAGFDGGDLIKHGTEQDNTQFSEMDKQVFVIMPNGDTFMTESWEQTQAFMWAAKQDNFLTYTNRSYVKDGETPTQTTFYPGQKDQGEKANAFSGTRLSFDIDQAAKNLGLVDV